MQEFATDWTCDTVARRDKLLPFAEDAKNAASVRQEESNSNPLMNVAETADLIQDDSCLIFNARN